MGYWKHVEREPENRLKCATCGAWKRESEIDPVGMGSGFDSSYMCGPCARESEAEVLEWIRRTEATG